MLDLITIFILSSTCCAIVQAGCPFADSLAFGRKLQARQTEQKKALIDQNILITKGMPAWIIWGAGPLSNDTVEMFENSMSLMHAQQMYMQQSPAAFGADGKALRPEQMLSGMTDQVPLSERCRPVPECDKNSQYRLPSGECNNLRQPLQGAAYSPFARLMPAKYADSFYSYRRCSNGGELPSERLIGNTLSTCNPYVMAPLEPLNHGGYLMGQMFTHDSAWRVTRQTASGETAPRCCTADYKSALPVDLQYPGCDPGVVPANDPFLGPKGIGCIDYIRSQPVFLNDGSMGKVGMSNSVSHQLDLSNIYGSTAEVARSVRPPPEDTDHIGELLNSPNGILPQLPNCTSPGCYFTGDLRGAFYPGLTMLHSVFVNLHNQQARMMRAINVGWTSDRVFEESRRLTVAMYQCIIYREWARLVLGDQLAADYNLTTLDGQGAYSGLYDESVDGSTMADFTSGAFRMFHMNTPSSLNLYDGNYQLTQSIPLEDTLQHGPELLETSYLPVARGLLMDSASYGTYPDNIRNTMFKNGNKDGVGLDLATTDVKRGRDHGLPCYTDYLHKFSGRKLESWMDMMAVFQSPIIQKLQSVYPTPGDIDMVVGVQMENKVNGHVGLVGGAIIAQQLSNWKFGDRHFYSLENAARPFSAAQLASIHQVNWAAVLCATTSLGSVQARAFEPISEWQNPLQPCNSWPIDYELWREKE